ncbi:MAG TPA: RNB domain-containing ribonuclease [Solirubrobacterales bacterium]|jgi:ribonuclease R|nr:RNB domain-containing ribonuclease [Solirubrobacterales bacterium]
MPDAAESGRPRALVVARRGRFWVGEPLFERGPQVSLARGRVNVEPGGIALCRIDQRGGQPIVDLGSADNARDVVGALIADRGLRPTFRDRHQQEARDAIAALQRDAGARRDLTAEPTFTVDPASARDFDDAVSAKREGDGFRIWVHIADVAAHVKPDSGLDREARARANSTYAPGTVSPMLPASLSSEACSLNPGVERLAVTAEIELSATGEARSAGFYRSRIRSDVRLDYDHLDRIFAGTERAPDPVAAAIATARQATAAIARAGRGAGLEVSSSEPEFTFTAAGDVEAAHALVQTEAHRLIEKLMILTNEQVARLLEQKHIPALYRVHEQPDPARVRVLIDQLASLGVPTPALAKAAGPAEAGDAAIEASRLVAAEAKRRGHGASSLSSLVLRALKPARYSEVNLGHAGLGSSAYSHFTSPIRRYPDLVAHRGLLAIVDGSEERPDIHEVAAAATHCSDRERESMRIERDGDDICAAFLLQRELFERGAGTAFEGEVSGVIPAGAFILFRGEHADVYEGFFPARRMPGERFEINDVESALIGMRTGRRVGIGDAIEVKVESVEAPRGRVDLIAAADQGQDRRRSGRRQPGRSRGGAARRRR